MISVSILRNFLLKYPNILTPLKVYNHISNAYLHRSSLLLGVKGIEIKMPSLSPTMTEGTIIKWIKKEGDLISPGDILCEIQTDKAVVGFELEEEGILAKILVSEDTKEIKIGTLIALMVEEGQDWKDVEIPVITSESTTQDTSAKQTIHSSPKSTKKTRMMGPAVKKLLEKYGINPDEIPASGPHQALLKIDVINHAKIHKVPQKEKQVSFDKPIVDIPSVTSSITNNYIDIPHTNMRRTIAKRLTESKSTIPHSYMSITSCVDKIIQLRKQLKSDGINVSVNDFVIKAVAASLQIVPEVNVHWLGNSIQQLRSIDISVAVATDKGLITPIVKDAAALGVQEISSTIKELAMKARAGKLQPHEFQGGSFSVSNLGMFGITEFTAVINPPQSSILAVGMSQKVLDEDCKTKTVMTSTLSFDGRVVDEITAARFLEALKNNLEDPINMIALTEKHTKAIINS